MAYEREYPQRRGSRSESEREGYYGRGPLRGGEYEDRDRLDYEDGRSRASYRDQDEAEIASRRYASRDIDREIEADEETDYGFETRGRGYGREEEDLEDRRGIGRRTSSGVERRRGSRDPIARRGYEDQDARGWSVEREPGRYAGDRRDYNEESVGRRGPSRREDRDEDMIYDDGRSLRTTRGRDWDEERDARDLREEREFREERGPSRRGSASREPERRRRVDSRGRSVSRGPARGGGRRAASRGGQGGSARGGMKARGKSASRARSSR